MQSTGIVLGLGLSGAIYINLGTRNLREAVPSASTTENRNALLGTSSTFFASLSPPLQGAMLHATVRAMEDTFLFALTGRKFSERPRWLNRLEIRNQWREGWGLNEPIVKIFASRLTVLSVYEEGGTDTITLEPHTAWLPISWVFP